MQAANVFRVDQWTDFFLMVGTAAAALTGLVFVAMSLNVAAIVASTAHRYRAVGNLIGLASIFILCGLVLMGGQNNEAIGAEVVVVSAIAAMLIVWGHAHTRGFRGEEQSLRIYRTIGRSICYALQITGGVVLITGSIAGLYMAAIGIIVNFYFMISGAWFLFVGAASEPSPPESGSPEPTEH